MKASDLHKLVILKRDYDSTKRTLEAVNRAHKLKISWVCAFSSPIDSHGVMLDDVLGEDLIEDISNAIRKEAVAGLKKRMANLKEEAAKYNVELED